MTSPQVPYYYATLDFQALWRDYPPPPRDADVARASADQIRALQEQRFAEQVARAWTIPFYQRLWGEAGMQPGDIRVLDDLSRCPSFTVSDLRESIDRAPPFGDFTGVDPKNGPPTPWIFHTSGGTTGLPRPMLYSPKDREVVNILGARRLHMAGIRAGDMVQVTHSLGLSNAGMSAGESLWKYSGAVPVMTGSGSSTPSRRQIELAKAWGSNALIGFAAYMRHLALVCRDEMRIDPRDLGIKSICTHLGTDDRASLEDLWNAKVYDSYGANEAGMIAADCEARSGMHVFEDAHYVEVVDPVSGQPVPTGAEGTAFITSLYKHAAPMIRFNINDITAMVSGECSCGSRRRRLRGILGRSDNMVKLRGVNVFPDAIGGLIQDNDRMTGDYVCIVDTVAAGRDEMTTMVEASGSEVDREALRVDLEQRLREVIGVKIAVEVVDRGALDRYTGLSQTSKVKRLIDRRKDKHPGTH